MEQNDSSGWKIAVQDLKKPWKELGGGSFGMVVAGTYLGTSVAIKCVGYNLNVEDNQLFEREVKTLMCSSHPSIIRCIGVSFDADKGYLVTELAEGRDLSKRLKESPQLSILQKLSLLQQVAQAMAFLHNVKGIVHRDLKGSNIVLKGISPTGPYNARVCDFGMAREVPSGQSALASVVGSPLHMAPELCLGDPYSFSADVFSFGVVVMETLIAPDNPKRKAPAQSYALVYPERPSTAPRALWELMVECTKMDPKERPNFCEILVDIETIVAAEKAREGNPMGNEGEPAMSGEVKQRASDAGVKRERGGGGEGSEAQGILDIQYLKVDKPLERFNIERSAMSPVGDKYLGTFMGTPVVIEKLALSEEEGQQQLQRFTREMFVLLGASHPNIVRSLGVAMTEEEISIVTEHCEMGDLHQWIYDSRNRTLTISEKLGIFKEIAEAMAFLHHFKGVVHRNLRTSNILLKGGAEELSVRVSAFYKSREVTDFMTVMDWTYIYNAPETFSASYGKPADVFSFGVIMWEVLKEASPPVRKNPVTDYAFKAVQRPETIDENLWNIAVKCLSQEAKDRPTFIDIIAAFEEIDPKKSSSLPAREEKKSRHSGQDSSKRRHHRHREKASPDGHERKKTSSRSREGSGTRTSSKEVKEKRRSQKQLTTDP